MTPTFVGRIYPDSPVGVDPGEYCKIIASSCEDRKNFMTSSIS